MCQSWALAWWKMRVWQLKEVLPATPFATSLIHTPLLAALHPDNCSDSIVYGAGLWRRSGNKASLKRERGWDKRKEAAFHWEPVWPLKPHRTITQPSAVMGRGATVSPRGTSASQEKAQLLVQPIHKQIYDSALQQRILHYFYKKGCYCLSPLRTAYSQIKRMGSLVSVICPVLSIRKTEWGGFSSKFPSLFTSLTHHSLFWFYYPWWERKKKWKKKIMSKHYRQSDGTCDSQQFCCAVDFSLLVLPLWTTSKVHKSHKGMEVNRFSPTVQDLPLH